MTKLIDKLYRFRYAGWVAVMALLFFLLFVVILFPKVTAKYQAANETPFRLQLAWTGDNFRNVLTDWSTNDPQAVAIYKVENLLELDFLFPLVYSLLIASAYAWGRGTSARDSRLDYLFPPLAVLTALLDYSENALHLYLLWGVNNAEQIAVAPFSQTLVGLSTIVSSSKFVLFAIGSAGVFVAVGRRLLRLNRAPKTASTGGMDLPLQLFEVLEQEYLTIHGEISQRRVISLRGRDVTAVLDWSFDESHIRDENALWNRLHALRAGTGQKSLAQYFKGRLDSASEGIPYDFPSAAEKPLLTKMLNQLLEVKLYDPNQFKHDSLPTVQPIVDLGLYSDQTISGDPLRQFNRYLLEDLFPQELEKVRDIRLAAIIARLHEKRQSALALSGGGTRSGTFALGLLQGLARHKLLGRFNYLSTVSGGGYIGGWLSAWILRHQDGFAGVSQDLVNDTPSSKIDPDPAPIGHLRAYSNFLTPKVGLFSTDTWTFLAIYGRNLLLNWSVLIPILLAFLLIPRLAVSVVLAEPQFRGPSILGLELFVRHLLLLLGSVLAVCATAYAGLNRPGFRTRLKDKWSFLARRSDQDGFLIYCLMPLFFSGLFLTTYWAWTTREGKTLLAFAVFGALLPVVAGGVSSLVLRRKGKLKELVAASASGGLSGLAVGAAANFLEPLGNSWSTEIYVCAALPLFLLIFHLGSTIFVGLVSHTNLFNDEDREWWARFNALSLIAATAWAVFTSLVLFGPLILLAAPKTLAGIGSASGLVATLLGRSEKTPSNDQETKNRFGLAMDYALPAVAGVFLAILIASLSLLTSLGIQQLVIKLNENPSVEKWVVWVVNLEPLELDKLGLKALDPNTLEVKPLVLRPLNEYAWLVNHPLSAATHFRLVQYPSALLVFVLMVGLGAIGLGLSRAINLNYFSLHGGYRNRLIRGFLGASRGEGLRKPNPFTGFDPADNIFMHELLPALLHESDFCNLDGLARRLTENAAGPDPQAKFLFEKLSDRVKEELRNELSSDANPPVSQRLKVDLIEDLNRILEDTVELSQQPVFENVSKSVSARKIPTRDYQIHRNRWVLETAFKDYIRKSDYPPHRLFHVVNITLNLVGGNNLAWQQRKAESFTVTPLHAGAHRVGYRKSRDYGGVDGISMGTAFSVSGAAASSNMGYYTSSPLISLLLTFFNVRLGWWLGNPGIQGSRLYTPYGSTGRKLRTEGLNRIYRRASPVLSISPIFYEAFGLTDDQHKYVYLSDGGHFENLALYEMVLRRCNLIVLADGAADPKYEFSDLGNAIRKIRIDLGIRIEFDEMPIFEKKPEGKDQGGAYWAIAQICYSDVDGPDTDGVLIYIKPAVYFDEPQDICNYKRQFPQFPHETTADQFFDEPQFESHRALGSYIMQRMCETLHDEAGVNNSTWRALFIENLAEQLTSIAPQVKKPEWLSKWIEREGISTSTEEATITTEP